jgi:cell division protein FtsI/penicillin-binding protein 2
MNATEALAWSCNSYFAALAATLPPGELERALRQRGLLAATGLVADESVAEFRAPHTAEQAELAALGVEGVRVTLLELAEAYRSLAAEMERAPASAAARTVRAGIADSASFGMASAVSANGASVAGKTGTAQSDGRLQTHGWFVGLAPAGVPRVVVAVYVPAGRGIDAAAVAALVLAHAPARQK